MDLRQEIWLIMILIFIILLRTILFLARRRRFRKFWVEKMLIYLSSACLDWLGQPQERLNKLMRLIGESYEPHSKLKLRAVFDDLFRELLEKKEFLNNELRNELRAGDMDYSLDEKKFREDQLDILKEIEEDEKFYQHFFQTLKI